MPDSFDNQFETLILKSPVPTAVLEGQEMRLIIANDAILQIWRKDRTVIGENLFHFLPELKDQPYPDLLNKAFASGEDYIAKDALISFSIDGKLEEVYLDFSYIPLKHQNGNVYRILITAIDVTKQVELKKSIEKDEHRMMLAIESAQMGTWEFYPQTLELKFSSIRTRELIGFSNDEEVTLAKTIEKIHPEDREYVQRCIADALDPSKNGNFDSIYRVTSNNKEVWIHSKGKTFFNEEGIPYFTTGIIFDITESKLTELRKNDFIAMVSHELKTPLTSIKSYIQIVLNRIASETDQVNANALKKAETQANKMTRLIQGFLDINSLEGGGIHLNKTQFSLKELFDEIVSDARILAPEHQFDLKDFADITVYADRDKIGQVIFNLLSNAVKYSSPGSSISLSCLQTDHVIHISITDNGIGISEKDQLRLFERFYRVDSDRVKMASGFGIGLYLSAEIIKQHNGTIGVQSEEGVGSTFWFEIPI